MRLVTLLPATCAFALAAPGAASAQDAPTLEVGVRAGVLSYQGDVQSALLSDYGSRVALGASVRYPFAEKWAVRAIVEGGTLAASDLDADPGTGRFERGFSFEAPLVAIEASVEWLPFRRLAGLGLGAAYSRFNPYVHAGVGYTRATAEVQVVGAPDDTRFPEEGDRATFLAVPVGGGLRYDLPSGFAIGAEVTGRTVFSDLLDGVSANASPAVDDYYWTGMLWVSYALRAGGGGRGEGCPVW